MHRSYWNRLLHSKKMIFVIFAAFSLHLLILLRTEPDAYLYQQMWKQLPQEQMTTMQQEECLRYVKREQKRQKNYAAHIQNICENAKSMQLFSFFAQEGSFDQKNLQSTLEQYGISVKDIVEGKVNSEDLSKYGISSNLLDGLTNGSKAEDADGTSVEDVINNAEIPRDVQMTAIENADMPQIFKDLLRENNNSETYEELGVDTFAQYVGKFLAKAIVHVVAFLITFLIVTIILRAIIFALDFIADLPGVGILNRLAGGVIGIAGAAIVVWVLFMIITLLYTTSVGKSVYDAIQAQPYLRVLYEYNPIMKLATIFR